MEQNRIGKRYQRLSDAICELIEDMHLLSFVPLCVEDKECMYYLLGEIDKANGYVFGSLTSGNERVFETAIGEGGYSRLMQHVKDQYFPRSSQEMVGD
jgi:hypothetical protein